MRTIKFRVRDKNTKKLLGFEHFNTTLNNGFYYVDANEPEEDRVCHSEFSEKPMLKPEHPMSQLLREEFIGLVDAKGKDIYEGDIVQKNGMEFHHVIKFGFWDNGLSYENGDTGYGFYLFDPNDKDESQIPYDHSDYVVIGNIHENPELLNDSK